MNLDDDESLIVELIVFEMILATDLFYLMTVEFELN